MSYLVVIVLLALAVFVEFLLVRKGLKAGRRSSQRLQSSAKSASPIVQNRVVPDKIVTPEDPTLPMHSPVVSQTEQEQEMLVEPPGNAAMSEPEEPAASVPGSPSNVLDLQHIKRERQPQVRPEEAADRSMLDIIQEIRSGSVQPSQREAPFSLLKSTPPTSEEIADQEQEDVDDDSVDAVEEVEYEETVEYLEESEYEQEEEPQEDLYSLKDVELGESEEPFETKEETENDISPEEQIKLGLELVRQGKLDEGITSIEAAVEQVPDKPDAHFNLGIAHTLKDNIPEAIHSYHQAIAIDPHYGKAFYNLGTLYLKQGNLQEAIPNLEQAVKLLPDPMKALWNLYEAYRSDGLFTKALANLERLIELEPDDASLHNHLGICYVKLGDYAKAIKSWKRAISLGASSHLIHYNLGKTYELYGELSNARKHYEIFVKMAANKEEWQGLFAEVHERLANLQAGT